MAERRLMLRRYPSPLFRWTSGWTPLSKINEGDRAVVVSISIVLLFLSMGDVMLWFRFDDVMVTIP